MSNYEIAELLDKTYSANKRTSNQALQQLAKHLTIEQLETLTPTIQADAYAQ